MRTMVVVCVIAVSTTAVADSKAIDAVVKRNVVGLGKLEDNDELAFAQGATVIHTGGSSIDMSQTGGCVPGAVANAFYGCNMATITHKLGTVISGVDDAKGIAWFQAPFTAVVASENPDGKSVTVTEALRAGGIVIRNGKNWEIAAEMFSQLVSDKELLAGTGGKPATGAPKLSGDAKLAAVVAGWFPSGFEAAAAKAGTLIASGTSAAELKRGAGATQLAKSFDKLKLAASAVDARVLAGGAIGWVVAEVTMPRKNGKGAVAMRVAIVVVPDGTGWRWVSFLYQFPTTIG